MPLNRTIYIAFVALLILAAAMISLGLRPLEQAAVAKQGENGPRDRSPIDLVLTPDDQYLLTANQTSDSVSLVRIADEKVVDELPVGRRPTAIAISADGKRAVVTCSYAGEVISIGIEGEKLSRTGSVRTSFEPHGVVLSPDAKTAYVAMASGSAIAVIDVASMKMETKISVGPWPRWLALSADGSRLAVATNGDRNVSVIDTAARKVAFEEGFGGINAGQMQISKDGKQVYFPWMVYRHNPIDVRNIKLGWVLGSRIGRVRLDKSETREAITLDVPELAVADPHGLAITSDEQWIVCAASGTHELLVYRSNALAFQSVGGPGDHIEPTLRNDRKKFFRIPLSGRPMTIRLTRDDRRAYVANYLTNCRARIRREIHSRKPGRTSLKQSN